MLKHVGAVEELGEGGGVALAATETVKPGDRRGASAQTAAHCGQVRAALLNQVLHGHQLGDDGHGGF